jgi:hypothetical protein
MVTAIEKSTNRKIGNVSATYVAQQSCPDTCKLKGNGCYAENDFVGFTTRRLNKLADGKSLLDMAHAEAKAILTLKGDKHLRLHVVGDCSTDRAASIVSDAAGAYQSRKGMSVWSYTHAWRNVERESWQQVSILASCESIEDVIAANKKGYAAAMLVESGFETCKQNGFKLIRCPQTKKDTVTCESCRLCAKDKWLRESKTVICFPAHSAGAKKAGNSAFKIIQ